MPLTELLAEAERQLTVCNACRYCEAYCAVFPAIELRTRFDESDVRYIANLCHDCRSCYFACMYAPPHEFGVNIPLVLSSVRLQTYEDQAWPRGLAAPLGRGAASLIGGTALGTALMLGLAALFGDPGDLLREQLGPGAFYRVLPYAVLIAAFLAFGAYVVVAMVGSFVGFWRATRGALRELLDPRALAAAADDVLGLRYLRGGGEECPYPGDTPSRLRRLMHSLVFYGFLAAFAATVIAAVMQDVFNVMPPYPLLSAPVVLGTLGGLGMVVGASVLAALKWRSDTRPAAARMLSWDYAFLGSLVAVSLTGLLTLALRETAAMGALLVLHLGTVAAFFLTMPYGKFAHLVYRSSALIQHHVETRG